MPLSVNVYTLKLKKKVNRKTASSVSEVVIGHSYFLLKTHDRSENSTFWSYSECFALVIVKWLNSQKSQTCVSLNLRNASLLTWAFNSFLKSCGNREWSLLTKPGNFESRIISLRYPLSPLYLYVCFIMSLVFCLFYFKEFTYWYALV